MEFFNKLGNLANKASKKTGDLTREAKLKIKINENKSKIEDLYVEIGKVMYQKHIDSTEYVKEDISSFCEQIDGISNEIKEYQNELRKIKKIRLCENCHEEIEISMRYCPHCGCEQPEEEVCEAEIYEEDKEETEVENSEEIKDENESNIENNETEEIKEENPEEENKEDNQ